MYGSVGIKGFGNIANVGLSSCTGSSILGLFSIGCVKNTVPGRLIDADEAVAGTWSEHKEVDAGVGCRTADDDVSVTGFVVEYS